MDTFKSFEEQLYQLNDLAFEDIAVSLFRFQASNNPVYRQYINGLGVDVNLINSVEKIPYLPITFFKTQSIQTGEWNPEIEFVSSGTTGAHSSKHLVRDLKFYLRHSRRCFEFFFGDLRNYNILALLPSYLERKNSSLVAMIDYFIRESQSPASGFYLHNYDQLVSDIDKLRSDNRKTILWGVSFALLDVAEKYQLDLNHCIIFETGGMKGRRAELTRQEMHAILKQRFHVGEIFSEYGMTELLSQCYSSGGESFFCPPSVRIQIRDVTDPFQVGIETVGGINVADLANFHSISFIETEDLGKKGKDGSFEVVGRIDNSEVRGCNLLIE
ncbi:MAG TPA: acyl transferase [Cyclobacteriaceae bacterium]|nr:acyl transferase [Cyclobacteriaceae bacterium]